MNFGPHPVVGFGDGNLSSPAVVAGASPWPMLLASSVVSAVAGLAIEEVVLAVKKKRKQR